MQELGEAGYLSKENILVLKSKTALGLPEASKLLNKPVFIEKRSSERLSLGSRPKKIGEIKEIFGPVKTPYFSISPRHGVKAEKLLHKKLYIG